MKCQDELPPLEPEFPFVTDMDTRLGIEDRIRAAWIDFNAKEWLGATTSAAVALEAVLLWEVKRLEASSHLGAGRQKARKLLTKWCWATSSKLLPKNRLVMTRPSRHT
jgi:hypothetical protein